MLKTKNRGFSLVELLIVISIIGLLSSIVLPAVNSGRTKANNAKVKAQLSSIRDAAEVYYSTNGNYGATVVTDACPSGGPIVGMFADTTSNLAALSNSVNYPTLENTLICNSSGTEYAVSDQLSSGFWCVDSNGSSKAESAALTTSPAQTQCP